MLHFVQPLTFFDFRDIDSLRKLTPPKTITKQAIF